MSQRGGLSNRRHPSRGRRYGTGDRLPLQAATGISIVIAVALTIAVLGLALAAAMALVL